MRCGTHWSNAKFCIKMDTPIGQNPHHGYGSNKVYVYLIGRMSYFLMVKIDLRPENFYGIPQVREECSSEAPE